MSSDSPESAGDLPSSDAAAVASAGRPETTARVIGPVRIVDASLARQLLGFVVAFVGLQLFVFGTDVFGPARIEVTSGLFHVALGTFAIANGLYLGGVRPR